MDKNILQNNNSNNEVNNYIKNDIYYNQYNKLQKNFLEYLPEIVIFLNNYTTLITESEFKTYDIDNNWYFDISSDFLPIYKNKPLSDNNLKIITNDFINNEKEKIRISWQNLQNHRKRLISKQRKFNREIIEDKSNIDNNAFRHPVITYKNAQKDEFYKIISNNK